MTQTITIRNERFVADIATRGAELQSLRTTEGREYNWQGTPPYWTGRGPILFPATGAPWNGEYFFDGQTYKMPKHGFVKTKDFIVESQSEDAVALVFAPDAESREFFPFNYKLLIRYSLTASGLRAEFEVLNFGTESLYFQIGGHPALAVPEFHAERAVNGYVKFHATETERPLYLLRAREQGCITPGRFPVPADADGLVPLCVETFADEALIFENHQVRAVELLDSDRRPVAMVESDAPCWLVWQMQGVNCPFVCFEPWYGLPDNENESRELSKRPYVQQAFAGGLWKGGFTVIPFV